VKFAIKADIFQDFLAVDLQRAAIVVKVYPGEERD
jgi:hypothetical protein